MKVTMMIHIKIHFYLFISFFLDQLILRKILSVFKKVIKKSHLSLFSACTINKLEIYLSLLKF